MLRYDAILLFAFAWMASFGQTPVPYHDPRSAPLQYPGPGREDPEPTNLTDVRIGYFGPDDLTHPEGGQIRMGANLALEQANRAGGYKGLPFRLVTAWADNPWKGGVSSLARITYADHVWAILGGIDGATTHLAEQVIAKALVTLVNPAATDRSIHTAGVPWVFSCVPGDDEQARVLSQELKRRGGEFAVLSATDHDARALAAQLNLALARDHLAPSMHAEFESRTPDTARLADSARASAAPTIVVVADARDSLALIAALRSSGFTGTILASASVARLPGEKAPAGVLYPEIGSIPDSFSRGVCYPLRASA